MIRIAVVDDEITFVHEIEQQLSDFLKGKSIGFQINPYTEPAAFSL